MTSRSNPLRDRTTGLQSKIVAGRHEAQRERMARAAVRPSHHRPGDSRRPPSVEDDPRLRAFVQQFKGRSRLVPARSDAQWVEVKTDTGFDARPPVHSARGFTPWDAAAILVATTGALLGRWLRRATDF